jgi:heat shock protein HtpX
MDRQFAHAVGQLFTTISNVTVSAGSNLFLCALSRNREYFADAVGAALTSPDAMQRALIRIHSLGNERSEAEKSHDVLMLRGGWSHNPFSTHPTLEQRLAALKSGEYQQLLDNARDRQARRAEITARVKAELTPKKLAAHGRTAYGFVKPHALEIKEALPSSFLTRIPATVWVSGMFVLVAVAAFEIVRVLL